MGAFRNRKLAFEALLPREMLSASPCAARMVAAHAPAISAPPVAGQWAMVSACGQHPVSAASSSAIVVANHLAYAGTLNITHTNIGAALTKVGTGTLMLRGANTYNGGMMVSAGTMTLNGVNEFTGAVTVTGPTLYRGSSLNLGGAQQGSGINGNAGTLNLGGGTLELGSGSLSLTLNGPNNYTGSSTTITTGTIAAGLNSGSFNVNPVAVTLGSAPFQSGTTTFGTILGQGAMPLVPAANASLTFNGTLNSSANNITTTGTLAASTSANNWNGSGLVVTNGVLSSNSGAPTIGANSTISVNGGTLRFNNTSGTPTIGSGVPVTANNNGATLELAGSVSDLSNLSAAADRVHIVNNSTAASVLVSGTNQPVGAIDGTGSIVVNTGSDLTANHIVQDALVIGGTATTTGVVTISASDASGNPVATNGILLAGSLAPSSPFASGVRDSSSLSAANSSSTTAV